MPTDTALPYRNAHARNFALRGVAWSLFLFAAMRLRWIEAHAVLPLTSLQAWFATAGFGAPALPIQVTAACSGTDALALCAAAILAYPARWPVRLAGAAGGIALVLALNTLRIGTLGRAAGSAAWFAALHVYVWPAVITLAIAGYVFAWMRYADRPAGGPLDVPAPAPAGDLAPPAQPARITRTFIGLTLIFLVLFTAASPFYLESGAVLAVAAFVARAAAAALRLAGIPADATGNLLSTARGAFVVTQECISTPLIPVYLAAVGAYAGTWRQRAAGAAALVPLFVGLGIARLLVVALPAALIGSPLFLIHAFYQLVLAAVLVGLIAVWRHGAGARACRLALGGMLAGALVAYLLAPLFMRAQAWALAGGAPLADPQGAIGFLPAYQAGLFVALSFAAFGLFRWRLLVAGAALLATAHVAVYAALTAAARLGGFTPHVRDVRAWAVAGPLLLVVAMVTYERPRG